MNGDRIFLYFIARFALWLAAGATGAIAVGLLVRLFVSDEVVQ